MKKFLLSTVMAFAFAAPAYAQATDCTPLPGGGTFCDPTSLHVTSPGATGSDPVLLNDANTFTITEVGNKSINDPIRVYFISALGTALPTISGATGVGPLGAFTIGPTSVDIAPRVLDLNNGLFDGALLGTLIAGQDFGKQLGIGGGSLSFTNFLAEYTKEGFALPNAFQIEEASFNVPGGGFNSDADFLTVNGSFALGTIIAPVAVDLSFDHQGNLNITAFDTSWTNAGIINTLSGPPVPEASTWVMLLSGFGLMALGALYRGRSGRGARLTTS
jgi:hypothetical protein